MPRELPSEAATIMHNTRVPRSLTHPFPLMTYSFHRNDLSLLASIFRSVVDCLSFHHIRPLLTRCSRMRSAKGVPRPGAPLCHGSGGVRHVGPYYYRTATASI